MGLANYFPKQSNLDFWDRVVESRRGYPVPGGYTPSIGNWAQDRQQSVKQMMKINPEVPTRFARPFRSASSGQLAPHTPGATVNLRPDEEIDSTLLRSRPGNPDRPLFEYTSHHPTSDTDRNPYFRYQGLQRLGNLVTTRSNVYAIWITIGYFEVTPTGGPPNPIFPDGYQLGPELGLDTGEINRHRAFYLIDRSIPVGFRRGEDLNSEDTILLRRYIE